MILPRIIFLNALEKLVNSVLGMASDTDHLLAPLSGKIVKIHIDPPGFDIVMCFSEQGIQMLENYPAEPDVELRGSPVAFGLMSFSGRPTRPLFSGKVSMQGDSQVGHHFQQLFESLNIDWQQQLSRIIGTHAAQRVADFVGQGKQWFDETGDAVQEDISEYLQEESKILPAQAEADMMFDDVDQLRADSDRLEARVKRLHSRLLQHEILQ
ncbi:MAG: SCP2 sterol-binding domain-containing protein [Methylococcales bacterium]